MEIRIWVVNWEWGLGFWIRILAWACRLGFGLDLGLELRIKIDD